MKQKYLEYFMDSRIYSEQDIIKNIEETKRDFSNKNIKTNVMLNRFGIYEIVFEFKEKDTYINKFKIWFAKNRNKLKFDYKIRDDIEKENKNKNKNKNKINSHEERMAKYTGVKYGMYKQTKEYKPY